jgi:PAS domain S-box-containing protein
MDSIPYKKIVEIINEGLYIVNKDRVITYWNNAAERISGFAADEVVGRSCADDILKHVDDEGTNLSVKPLRTVSRGKRECTFTTRMAKESLLQFAPSD